MWNRDGLKLISEIYDLSLQPKRWSEVLDKFCQYFGAHAGIIQVFNHLDDKYKLDVLSSSYTNTLMPDVAKEYEENYYHYDQEVYKALLRYDGSDFKSDYELAGINHSDRDEKLPAVKWLRENFQVDHRAACRVNLHGAWSDIIGLHFKVGRGPITFDEQVEAKIFNPHWAKVIDLHRTFSMLRYKYDAVLSVLDRLFLGVFILSSIGEVIVLNEEARRILSSNSCLSVGRLGFLEAFGDTNRKSLNSAIMAALRSASATGNSENRVVSILGASAEDPLLIEVVPLRGDQDELEKGFTGAAVIIVDPKQTDVISTEGMAAIYNLTGAESEICRMIALGMDTDDVADSKNISRETVRTHVKRILSKTGTGNRSQLVRLAHKVNIPIR